MKKRFSNLSELLEAYHDKKISERKILGQVNSSKDLLKEVEERTAFLNPFGREVSVSERCWYLCHNVKEPQVCPICGKRLRAYREGRGIKGGYYDTCNGKKCISVLRSKAGIIGNEIKHHSAESAFERWQSGITSVTVLTDEIILKKFYNGGDKYNKQLNNLTTNPILRKWLLSRFEDTESVEETVKRLKLKIYEKPRCKNCGKPLRMNLERNTNRLFGEFCSNKCSAIFNRSLEKKSENVSIGIL